MKRGGRSHVSTTSLRFWITRDTSWKAILGKEEPDAAEGEIDL
jgi:hypothetical protein